MTGFGNDNNEKQDFSTLNMGSESMFSDVATNPDAKNADVNMFSEAQQGLQQEGVKNTTAGIDMPQMQSFQATQNQQAFQSQQVPQAQKQTQSPTSFDNEISEEQDDEVITVKPIRFESFENEVSAVGTPRKNLDIMQDVKAKITVELGRCKMKVKKVLDIQKGSIIEINKVAGEQVELFVCGKLVAHGEVIVIEDKFGLRITSIIEDKSL